LKMVPTDFLQNVYSRLGEVPFGKVTTYKRLAMAVKTKAYRSVGNAMRSNKDLTNIKCFKVVKSDGSLGGYALGAREKIRRLKAEGIEVKDGKIVDFKKKLFTF